MNMLSENGVLPSEEIPRTHTCNRRPEEVALPPQANFHDIAEKG